MTTIDLMHAPSLVRVRIDGQITWTIQRLPDGRCLGVCDPLGLSLEADDETELRSLIDETLHFVFLDLLQEGQLEKYLEDRGWKFAGAAPAFAPEVGYQFDVPVKMVPTRAA